MKKTISLILCFAMILSTVAFAMPAFALDFEVEAAEDFAQAIETPEVNLAGTMGNDDGKPGINLLTGTKDVYDFEDSNFKHARMINRDEGLIPDPDDASNTVMWVGDEAYSNIGIAPVPKDVADGDATWYYPLAKGKTFENERPFTINFDLKGNSAAHNLALMTGIGNAKVNGGTGWHTIQEFTVQDGMNWVKMTGRFTYASAIKSTQLFVLCFYNNGMPAEGTNWYIDNLEIIPDYKVSYYAPDGKSVTKSVYVEGAAKTYEIDEAIAAMYEGNEKFLGFKLVGEDDSNLLGDVITLANQDLNIIPVLDTDIIAPEYVKATANATFTVSAKYAGTWSVDDETLASIEGNGDTAVITTKGYPGTLGVTVVSDEDPTATDTVYIRLRNGSNFKPGVNMLTGTEEPFGFEESQAEVMTSISLPRNAVLEAIPEGKGNSSKYGVKMYHTGATGQQFPQLIFGQFQFGNVEYERPHLVSYDWQGRYGNVWLLGDKGNATLTSPMAAPAGGSTSETFVHVDYAWTQTNKHKFCFQAGLDPVMSTMPLYIDNLSIVPYYKVSFADATGAVQSFVYVSPLEETYTIPADKIAALDASKYAGYKLQGTDELITEFAVTGSSDFVLVPATKEGVEVVAPVSVTGYNGKTTDIDPKFPGAYYVFDEPLDVDTLTLDELKNVWADSFTYDEETNTLIVFSKTKKIVGHSEYFKAYDSNIKTESGKFVVFPKTPTLAYGTKVGNDGLNMIPYGDFETAYNPFYTDDSTIDLSVEDGKLVAAANTENPSYPHVEFQTVVEAGATYQVYVETAAIEVAGEPAINIVFAGDSEGDLVNHASVDNYHVMDYSVADIENIDGTYHYGAEFTVTALDNDAETAIARAAIYSSPVEGKTVGYTVDNYELYRKTFVKYVPNDAVNAEGVEAPVEGAYLTLKGNVKNEEAFITVADYVFPAIDDKRYVAGWVSTTDGIVYAAGDTIDLASVELDENGDYVLTPVVEAKEGYEFVNITFDGTGASYTPADIEGLYMTGDVLPMAQFYNANITSTVSGERFLGWSVDGTKAGMLQPEDELVLKGDVHFTAITGYDYNFAIAESQPGWAYNVGSVTFEDGVLKARHKAGSGNDCYVTKNGVNISGGYIYKIIFWVEDEYTIYTDANHTTANAAKWKKGDTWEGLFFSHTNQGDNGSRRLAAGAYNVVTAANGKTYIGFEVNTTQNANWLRDDVLYKIRLDPNNIYGDFNLRYVQFVPFPEYDEDVIEITDLEVPEVGVKPDETATAPACAKIESITWTPSLSLGGLFKETTAYTAKIVLNPADSTMRFKADAEFVVAGYNAKVTSVDPANGKTTLEVKFPATEEYKLFDFDLSLVPSEIAVDGVEDIQLEINVTEEEEGVVKDVTWSIVEGDAASITSDGLLNIFNEGTITVQAASNYNENKVYTKDIVITLTDAVTPVVITFSDENVNNAPAAITRLAGDVLDLREFLTATSAVNGLNFNGWTLDGEELLTGEIVVPEEDITLYGVVNYDINFAVPTNVKGWSYSGNVTAENDMLMANNGTNTNGDVILQKSSGFAIPTSEYGKIVMYITKNCDVAGSAKKLAVGDSIEGIFFIRDIDGAAAADRHVGGKVVAIEGDFAVVELNMTASKNWTNNIKGIRFDIGGGLWSYGVRYIHFVEKTPYTNTEVQITGIDVPETGYDLDVTAKDAANLVEVTSITWTPDEFIEYNYDGKEYVKFDAEKTYTATIDARIPLGSDNKFAEGTTATVNGEEATFVQNADGTVTITYTFPATGAYEDFTMEITGPEVIAKEGRTSQYRLIIDGDIPVKTASFEIAPEFEGYAVMNPLNGKLTPIRNVENLKLIATSHYNSAVKAEFYVTLTNQAADSVIYYDANTTASVSNMPDPTTGAGRVKLTTDMPTRTGYICVGWAESAESRTPVEAIAVSGGETTVYAVWEKVVAAYEFNDGTTNNSAGAGSIKLSQTSATTKVENGYWELTTPNTTGQHDIRVYGNFTGVPSADADKLVVREANEPTSVTIELYTHKLTGSNYLGKSFNGQGLDTFAVHEFELANNALYLQNETFNQFWFDPFNGIGQTARIDYVRIFTSKRNVTFNANAGSDTVEGMPSDGTIKAGEKLKIVEMPTRAGYEFLGWALSADATEATNEFTVIEDTTVYAIWVKAIEVVDPALVDLGAITEEAVVVTAAPESVVTVTVTTDAGEEVLTATADENGLALVDLSGVEGTITAALATADTDIEKVVVTDLATAEALVEAAGKTVEGETNVTIKHNGVDADGSTGDKGFQYDNTVETVKPTGGAVRPSGQIGGVGEVDEAEAGASGDIKSDMASAGEILLNFNNKYEGDFFPTASLRQFTLNGMSDSVISFTNKGKASGSNDMPALFSSSFELDAATHPYIVMKIRNTTDSSCRIYFRTAEAGFAESRAISKNVASDYSMVVYDMSTIADWKGTVTGMFFSMGATAGEIIEIDWIMFTDKVPESMEAIEGTKELFPIVNKDAMAFEDVKADDWFYGEVSSAYRYGFVEGQSEKTYNPQGNVTVAEVITLAVRLNYSYNGKEAPAVAEGAEWYSNYVNAAVRAGIIKNTQFADYNAPALRKDVAQIMYKTLPSDYLKAINMFTSIPDVPTKDPAYGAIRKLYNAGVLTGMDGAYNFYPENNVTRAEIAAVVNRMALPANRKRIVTEAEIQSKRQYFYADDLETATLGNCYETKLSIKNGFGSATGKSGDPIVYLTNVVGQLNGKELSKITVALKWDESKIKANPVIFFTTPAGGWAAGRMLSSKNTGEKTANGSTIFTIDTKSNGQFADTITGIRFDPFDAKDIEFSIEYIIIE